MDLNAIDLIGPFALTHSAAHFDENQHAVLMALAPGH